MSTTPSLKELGWTEQHQHWADQIDSEGQELIPGRVAQVSRGHSLIFTGKQVLLAASGSTRLHSDIAPATGDFVVLNNNETDGAEIKAIADRSTAITRRAPGRIPQPQVLVTNIDKALVMHGLDRPMNPRRLERLLVIAHQSGAQPIIVLTKSDTNSNWRQVVDEVSKLSPNTPVIVTSVVNTLDQQAKQQHGIEKLKPLLAQGTAAMMGLSGIGKSSLVNALLGGVVQQTGEVRATDLRGRHTTVVRDLIPLPSGGMIIDTPGIREIGLWQAYQGIELTFPEIAQARLNCKFTNCEHQTESQCAVLDGIATNTIAERRLAHWQDLQAELAQQEIQIAEFERRADSRDRAELDRRRDHERSNTKRRSRADRRFKSN